MSWIIIISRLHRMRNGRVIAADCYRDGRVDLFYRRLQHLWLSYIILFGKNKIFYIFLLLFMVWEQPTNQQKRDG
jgi:hypothetical protein